MSQPSSLSPASGPIQKQQFSVYTMMLILSFIALTIGSLLLLYELQLYGGGAQPWNAKSAPPAAGKTSQLRQYRDDRLVAAPTSNRIHPQIGRILT